MSDGTNQYGFNWGPFEVVRVAEYRGSRVIAIRSGKHEVQIMASPTGRSMTVTWDGVRMEPRSGEVDT